MKKTARPKANQKLKVVRTTIRPLVTDSLNAAVGGLALKIPTHTNGGCGAYTGGAA